jgi:hypothetical protein
VDVEREHQPRSDDHDEHGPVGSTRLRDDRETVLESLRDPAAPPAHQVAITGPDGTIFQSLHDLYIYLNRHVPSIPVDHNEVQRATTRFAEPPGIVQATQTLQARSAVVLSAPVGTGRRTAALNLLATGREGEVRELNPDWTAPRTDVLPCERGRRYLLDLSDGEGEIAELFARELLHYADRLAGVQGLLVITTTPQRWHQCARFASGITVTLRRPDVKEILKVHLDRLDPDGSRVGWLDRELAPFVDKLRDQQVSLQSVVDLADRIRALTDPQAKLDDLEQEMRRWQEHLDKQFGGTPPDSFTAQRHHAHERALLIACAVLDGAPGTVIEDSAQRLLSVINATPPSTDLLVMPDLGFMLKDIEADRDGEALSITKRRHGVDEAVLDRVWTDRPQLRRHLWTWLAAITTQQGPAVKHVDRVASVLTRFALRHRSLEILQVIERWLERDRTRGLAVTILDRLAVSADVGAVVRGRLYQWATSSSSSDAQLAAVAEVCGGELGRRFIAAALTRLRLVARRADAKPVRQAVDRAFRRLAHEDELRSSVLAAVTGWLEEPEERRAGVVGLLSLLDPDGDDAVAGKLLADAATDPTFRDSLCEGWWTLLGNDETQADASTLVLLWYASADSGTLDKAKTVDFLTEFGHGLMRRSGPITVVFNLVDGSETRREVARNVIEKTLYPVPRHDGSPGEPERA